MNGSILKGSPIILFLLLFGVIALSSEKIQAQVVDADCFDGTCNGTPGIPACADGYEEVGFVTYANHHANADEDCVTVISCTNFNHDPIVIDCRFYFGFNSIPEGGGPQDALCDSIDPKPLFAGDTSECATDADAGFIAGGLFGAADGNCPTFEGKGLVCAKPAEDKDRIDTDRIICHVHLSCGNGSVLENITFVPDVLDDDDPGHHRHSRDKNDDD